VVSFDNPNGKITNSDLEMAGYLLLWLCMEGTAKDLCHKHIALFSDNWHQKCTDGHPIALIWKRQGMGMQIG